MQGVILLTLVATAFGQCQIFQSRAVPKQETGMQRCDPYAASSCCTPSASKRAYNWVLEDDGCGVVTGTCRAALTDLACAINCSPNLVVTGVNYPFSYNVSGPGKVVLCQSWAQELYRACENFQWCPEHLRMTTDCTFQSVSYSNKRTTLVTKTLSDTCQPVWDLQTEDFVENILGLHYHRGETSCIKPASVKHVAAAPGLAPASATLILAAALALAGLAAY